MSDPFGFTVDPDLLGPAGEFVRSLTTFDSLAAHVRSLPYSRVTDLANPYACLIEGRGTCSSKHRLLAEVAQRCGHDEVLLAVGIYEMSEQNTPGVGQVLGAAGVDAIPEAHCYLLVHGHRFDFTGLPQGSQSPFDALLEEHVVAPASLPATKEALHRHALAGWARRAGMSTDAAWKLREACIAALALVRGAPLQGDGDNIPEDGQE